MSAVPSAHEPEPMTPQRFGERRRRPRVGVSEFAPGVTGGAHFMQDPIQRNVTGEFVEIVVAPDDRIRPHQTVAKLNVAIGAVGGSGHENFSSYERKRVEGRIACSSSWLRGQ